MGTRGWSAPTFERVRLGLELERLRTRAGLTLEDAARVLGRHAASISRIETGKHGADPGQVRTLLDLYGASDEETDTVLALTRQAQHRDWFHGYVDVIPQWFQPFIALESRASELFVFDSLFVPGQLQTEAYTRALIQHTRRVSAEVEAERMVRLRRMRQQRLLDPEDGPRITFVVDEAAIRRRAGSEQVMTEQLRRLVELAARPHLTIQVFPFTAGPHQAMSGAFTIMGFGGVIPRVVYLEELTGGQYLQKEVAVEPYSILADHLRDLSLTPDESLSFLAELAGKAA